MSAASTVVSEQWASGWAPSVLHAAVAGIILAIAGACDSFQTYKQGMTVICNAPVDCKECQSAAADVKSSMLAAHISGNLHNSEAIEAFQRIALVMPRDKAQVLGQAAAEAGITNCPMVDLFAPPVL